MALCKEDSLSLVGRIPLSIIERRQIFESIFLLLQQFLWRHKSGHLSQRNHGVNAHGQSFTPRVMGHHPPHHVDHHSCQIQTRVQQTESCGHRKSHGDLHFCGFPSRGGLVFSCIGLCFGGHDRTLTQVGGRFGRGRHVLHGFAAQVVNECNYEDGDPSHHTNE